MVSGDGQSGIVGAQLAQPLIVKVTANGFPRPLQVLNFRVVSGNGSVFGGTELTDLRGMAQELWTLGTKAGDPQKVEVRAVDPVTGTAQVFATFTAVARPGATTRLAVSGLPSALTAGVSSPISATAQDAFGNTTIDYRGTVHFASTDPLAVLPPNHTFVAADIGSYNATAILKTAGIQTVTATDVVTGSITGSQTVTVPSVPPTISSFTAAPTSISNGTSTTLTAVFSGGTGTIDHGVGTVTSGTPVVDFPTATTTYTLTVTNAAGVTSTATATVTVVPFPTITSFAVLPTTVTSGGEIHVTAAFTGGTGLLNGVGFINVPVFSGVTVFASAPTTAGTYTYTLTVTNAAGGTAVALSILTVVPPPIITSFSAAATTITAGTSTTLTAVFAGGTATIDNRVGPAISGAPVSTGILTSTTTFMLTVTNVVGATVTASVTVTVAPSLPTILSFTGGQDPIAYGGFVSITALFTGGVGTLVHDEVVDPILSGAVVTVGPLLKTTIFTLTVTDGAGASAIARLTVEVLPPPVPTIVSFTAGQTRVGYLGSTILTAVFAGGTGTIGTGGATGPIFSGQGFTVGPLVNTTIFTLTVTNASGATATASVTVEVVLPPPPVIESFTAAATTINAGTSTTLTGVFFGGYAARIDHGLGDVTSGTPISTGSLTSTTTFTLTVFNVDRTIANATTATVTVVVSP